MRRRDPFTERYLDVLQNLEFGVIRVAQENPELIDAHVEQAYEVLIRYYKAEVRGYEPRRPDLPSPVDEVFESVHSMAEFRLGRSPLVNEEGEPLPELPKPITVKEMVKCLKWLRKSVQFWTQHGGRRGYLQYVKEFFPG